MAELDRKALNPQLRNTLVALWAMSIAAFIAVTMYYIVFHHMEPLSRDQWHMYDALFERGLLNTSFGTVAGHRHILAFLLYDFDMALFDGRNRLLITIDWLLNGALIVLLCTQVWRLPLSRLARTLFCGWIITLLVWLLNIALLGWGFNGINNYLSIVPLTLSLFCLHNAVHHPSRSITQLAGALLLGVLATLSFANGILVWPTALVCLYLWRAPQRIFVWVLAAAGVAITSYALLPGADAATQTLKWPGWSLLRFPVQVMGGPVYHLLRSWRFVSDPFLFLIANGVGVCVTLFALTQLLQLLRTRPPMHAFQTLCVTLICIGAGSTVMLTMSRLDDFLDFTVDRFQIFALLVWIGTSGLCISTAQPTTIRRWEILWILFPLLAFPAQLDWGARLAEYRTRVDNALLSYQVYLPVREDAEKALHWNWESKLPDFFSVLEHIRATQKNIFYHSRSEWLGKPFAVAKALPQCQLHVDHISPVKASDLLDASVVTPPYRISITTNNTASESITTPDVVVGQRWFLSIDTSPLDATNNNWDGGLILNEQNIVEGLIHPVRYSRLPRANGLLHDDVNAYGVARFSQTSSGSHQLVLFNQQTPLCRQAL